MESLKQPLQFLKLLWQYAYLIELLLLLLLLCVCTCAWHVHGMQWICLVSFSCFGALLTLRNVSFAVQ